MLTLVDIQNRFKKIGKLIYIANHTPSLALSLKRAHIGLVDQVASTFDGDEDDNVEFDVNDQVVTPLGTSTRKVTDSLSALPAKVISTTSTYLRTFIAVDLGLASNAALSQVGAALAAQMTAVGATVFTGGTIATWFSTNFGIVLPTDPTSPTIPDTYVTDAVG